MTDLSVRMRATYTATTWDDPEEEDYSQEHGWVAPWNPYGSFRQSCDDRSAEPDTEVLDTLWEAAEYVADFPGGVWNRSQGEPQEDYRTGESVEVTLHVLDHSAAVFALADLIEAQRARAQRRIVARYLGEEE